jgi:hypothetical protein
VPRWMLPSHVYNTCQRALHHQGSAAYSVPPTFEPVRNQNSKRCYLPVHPNAKARLHEGTYGYCEHVLTCMVVTCGGKLASGTRLHVRRGPSSHDRSEGEFRTLNYVRNIN